MRDLKIKDGDLVVSENDLNLVEGSKLLEQKVQLLLGTMQGEWFLDEEEGVDQNLLFAKNPDEDMLQDAIYQVLRQLDDSFEIDDFTINRDERTLKIDFTAHTENGDKVVINRKI